MSNITFDKDAKANLAKEDIEWIRIWCEDTNNTELPRVALIGDSITEGYYNAVKELLKDAAMVDYLATSYSVVSDIYHESVKNFIKDSVYDVVHFNYGLHAYSVDDDTYESYCREILKFISSKAKTVVATTTTVLAEKLEKYNPHWEDKVIARNEKIKSIAEELELKVNDLNAVCKSIDKSMRNSDGVHFADTGYKVLAENTAHTVKELLSNK